MRCDKMKRAEAVALTNFVVERLKKLDKCPMLFGKSEWHNRIYEFEQNFLSVLEDGVNTFHGAIWQFFECNDKIFIGELGMLELCEHTFKEGNSWIYSKSGKKPYVIYSE